MSWLKKDTFTDPRDGKVYKIEKIGSLIWMMENLAYDAEYSVCYDNDESNCQKYGRLYSFGSIKENCPPGWRVPRRDEWEVLTNLVGIPPLFGGYCDPKGKFHELGSVGTWWSYSILHACTPPQAWITSTSLERRGCVSVEDRYLFSIRCIKDNPKKGG